MEQLIVSFNAVVPLFIMMVMGYYASRTGLLSPGTVKEMNRYVFRIFFPILVFYNIYQADLSGGINFKLLLFAGSAIVVFMAAVTFMYARIEHDPHKRGVMSQASFRSNFVSFVIPIAATLYGEKELGSLPLLIATMIPLLNTLSVICLEMFRGGTISLRKILKGVAANPVIRASLIGIFLIITKIRMPYLLEKAVLDLSRAATPLSLIMLGATFRFEAVKENFRRLILALSCKLIIFPAVTLPIAAALGFRGIDILGLLILFGAPVAVASYSMAVQMDGDNELAAEVVVFSSLFSILTLFIWIFLLKNLAIL